MNFKFILKAISVALVSFSLTLISAVSFAATDVRIMWYGDGDKENVPIAAQIDEFNAANPDINVILDIVPYLSSLLLVKVLTLLVLLILVD